ncbi:MAG: hypothetical protein KQI78_19825 [Deltaproteobacteria bacterium]|nr:hypothetical protein [Deltaproteobacteria bacterium]
MKTLPELRKRLEDLEAEIAEAKRRLPAHSVKPPVMHMLLDLEDEYDSVMQQMAALKKAGRS